MSELLKEINDDFDCWDEYNTEHDLSELLGEKYNISVDKDTEYMPLRINGKTKRSKND